MRKLLIISWLLLPVASMLGASTVSAAGPLAIGVQGNQLVDGSGHAIQLRGVNRSGTEYSCTKGYGVFDGPSTAESVAAMASWHVNAVRVPLNEDCWLSINNVPAAYSGYPYRNAIMAYVNTLNSFGMYAILDLHFNAPGSFQSTGPQVMADADHSPAFWYSVASTFAANPAVIFDLYNEPHDISWQCLRDGCKYSFWNTAGYQTLVTLVRDAGANQPIMLGGLGWSSDLRQWLAYRPNDPRGALVASFHSYNYSMCNDPGCWDGVVRSVAASTPVVTGELGENDCNHNFIDGFMNWADSAGVSYLGWAWNLGDCSGGPTLIADFSGTPTGFGVGLQDHLAALAGVAPAPVPRGGGSSGPRSTGPPPPPGGTASTVDPPADPTTGSSPTASAEAQALNSRSEALAREAGIGGAILNPQRSPIAWALGALLIPTVLVAGFLVLAKRMRPLHAG